MTQGSLGRRYARALLGLAAEKQIVQEVLDELEALDPLFASTSLLSAVFMNPGVSSREKKNVIEALITKAGLKTEVANLLRVLQERKRIPVFSMLVRAFRELADEFLSRLRVEVSLPLVEGADLSQVQAVLERKLGKKILLNKVEDPSLLGGLVIKVGDKVFDGSLRTQLHQIQFGIEKVGL